jgi:hypothetical protein
VPFGTLESVHEAPTVIRLVGELPHAGEVVLSLILTRVR